MSTQLLFRDLPPREERAVRLKRDDATNLAPVEIGLRGGEILLPKGAVSGVQLESVLRRLSKVRGFQRFDELPIPFRAVATDLVTGRPVVLSQGELPAAMRASMSVPGVIEPLRLDSRLLVDGGLTNNLPVDVARAMGADIVIAVNLGTPLLKAESLNSILGVTGQMVNILTEQNVQASLASLRPTDVLIVPQLGDFSATDFDHLSATVPIGEAAARAVADQLAKLSVSPAEYDAWQRASARRNDRGLAASGRDPLRQARAREPRHRARGAANANGLAHRRADARPRHAAPVRHGRLRACELPAARGAGQAHPLGRCRGEGVGPELRAVGSRAVDGLSRRRLLQSARELPHDVAQQARRRVAHRSSVRPHQPHLQRVLSTCDAEPDVLRRAQRVLRTAHDGHLPGQPAHRALRDPRRPDRSRSGRAGREVRRAAPRAAARRPADLARHGPGVPRAPGRGLQVLPGDLVCAAWSTSSTTSTSRARGTPPRSTSIRRSPRSAATRPSRGAK